MLEIPELDGPSVVFGSTAHMPKYATLPEDFKRNWSNGNPYCAAISKWFFAGAKRDGDAIVIDGKTFRPKEGVNTDKALRAIKAVLGSFEPKHEHKIAGCGFMLSEWFDLMPSDAKATS